MRPASAPRVVQTLALICVALLASACSAAAAPTWTFGPAAASAGGAPSASAPPSAVASPVASPSPTASPAPTPTPAPTLAVAAIDFTPGTKASPRVVNMTADDNLNFIPGVVTVAKGETVTFRIKNVGKAEHEFMIGPVKAAFADTEGTPEVAGIKAGKTASLTVTFDQPGQYAFACHEPGHFEHGMLGFVIVVGPDVPAIGTLAEPRPIAIDMTDKLVFSPDTVQARPGETIRFVLTNSGAVTHEFQVGPEPLVAEDKVDGVLDVEKDELDAGSTHDVVYTLNGSGPYAFACHEPGHFEAGMKGTVELVKG